MTIYNRATEHPGTRITRRASGTVTTKRFVKVSGAQCSVSGERTIGVSIDGAVDLDLYGVTIDGTALVTAVAALGQGVEVSTDANGKAQQARRGDWIAGITMEACGAGEDVEVMIGAMKKALSTATSTTTTTTSSSSSSSSSSTTTTTTAP